MINFVDKIDESLDNVVTLIGEIGTFDINSTDKLVTNKNYINGLYFSADCANTFNNSWKVTLKSVAGFDTLKELIKKNNEGAEDTYTKVRCVIKGTPTNANYKNKDTDRNVYQQAIDVQELTILSS